MFSSKKTPSIFCDVSTETLTNAQKKAIRKAYVKGSMGQIFPASSGVVPPLFVGRESQMGKVDRLVQGITDKSASEGIHGVVLHGPRGTGKTAMIDAIETGALKNETLHIIRTNGNTALTSVDMFLARIAEQMSPLEEKTTSTKTHKSVKGKGIVAEGEIGRESQTSSTQKPHQTGMSIESGFESVLLHNQNKPLLLLIDEAHGADPSVLGMMMNSVQSLAGQYPIGFVLAGTPDTLDVLRDPACKATWFRDRAQEKRFAPLPNDLSVDVCRNAIVETLDAAGVRIQDNTDLEAMLARCKGSPYFLQVLGEAALHAASQCDDIADFSVGGEIDHHFEMRVQDRYQTTWADLEGRNLSGCARQLGRLWHRQAQVDEEIDFMLVEQAIRSGIRNAPYSERQQLSFEEAQTHFKHLGLLWSMTGYDEGPWSLGLPSFFDYVESKFHEPRKVAHQDVLAKLEADMDALFQRIGWGAPPQTDDF